MIIAVEFFCSIIRDNFPLIVFVKFRYKISNFIKQIYLYLAIIRGSFIVTFYNFY